MSQNAVVVEHRHNILHLIVSWTLVVEHGHDTSIEFLPAERHKHAESYTDSRLQVVGDAVCESAVERQRENNFSVGHSGWFRKKTSGCVRIV